MYGTPGSGKTRTVVEIVRQLAPRHRLLLCAATEGSVTALCAAIVKDFPGLAAMLFRVYSPSTVSGEPLRFTCNFDVASCTFGVPKGDVLRHFSIVATTFRTAGVLVQAGLGPGYFSYIITDQCDRVPEVEALLALVFATPNTRCVLYIL